MTVIECIAGKILFLFVHVSSPSNNPSVNLTASVFLFKIIFACFLLVHPMDYKKSITCNILIQYMKRRVEIRKTSIFQCTFKCTWIVIHIEFILTVTIAFRYLRDKMNNLYNSNWDHCCKVQTLPNSDFWFLNSDLSNMTNRTWFFIKTRQQSMVLLV